MLPMRGISPMLVLFITFFAAAIPSAANDPCEDYSRLVQAFVSWLAQAAGTRAGSGNFEVKPVTRGGVVTRWSVAYRISAKAAMRRDVSQPLAGEGSLEITAARFGGYGSLIFRYLLGAGGGI